MANTVLMFKLLVLALAFAGCQAACSDAYSKLNAHHSQCKTDLGKEIVVSKDLQQKLVDKHNEYRSMVKATDMIQVEWDSDMASTASKWARQCEMGHEPEYSRRAEPNLPGVVIGQNAAGGLADLMEALEVWYKEEKDFTYGVATNKTVAHYTQIIYAKTARIGCGEADCSGLKDKYPRVQICNYALGQGSVIKPYTEGASCSACQTCDSAKKLCVCPNTVCYNGAKLKVTDCTCTCGYGFSGDLCEKKNCNEDKSTCDMYFDQIKNPCDFHNVERDICPLRCGFCKRP